VLELALTLALVPVPARPRTRPRTPALERSAQLAFALELIAMGSPRALPQALPRPRSRSRPRLRSRSSSRSRSRSCSCQRARSRARPQTPAGGLAFKTRWNSRLAIMIGAVA
jgi:hypothetical protein